MADTSSEKACFELNPIALRNVSFPINEFLYQMMYPLTTQFVIFAAFFFLSFFISFVGWFECRMLCLKKKKRIKCTADRCTKSVRTEKKKNTKNYMIK